MPHRYQFHSLFCLSHFLPFSFLPGLSFSFIILSFSFSSPCKVDPINKYE